MSVVVPSSRKIGIEGNYWCTPPPYSVSAPFKGIHVVNSSDSIWFSQQCYNSKQAKHITRSPKTTLQRTTKGSIKRISGAISAAITTPNPDEPNAIFYTETVGRLKYQLSNS